MRHSPLRVIQVTDCHLLADPAARLHGWRNQQALDAVLAHIRTAYPAVDAVLLTGDLAHDETAAGYRRLAGAIRTLGAPVVCAMPGNHDDAPTMQRAMTDAHTAGAVPLGNWRLHILNSRIPGSDAGRLGDTALNALADDLAAHPGTPALIAVHHPPVPVGSAWLDTMRLRDGEALLDLLKRHPRARAVICGHVHQAFDAVRDGVRVLAAPAITRQFLPGSATFAEDRGRVPGYRALRLFADGRLTTRVRRVTAAGAARCAQNCG